MRSEGVTLYISHPYTHIVGTVVPLLPLHQDYLSHHQSGDEDQHHLSMHGLVSTVLHMQTLMLHPGEEEVVRGQGRGRGRKWGDFKHATISNKLKHIHECWSIKLALLNKNNIIIPVASHKVINTELWN